MKAIAEPSASPWECLSAASKGQLYEARLGDGSILWLEVVAGKGPRVQLLCYGEAIEVNLSVQPAEVRHKGAEATVGIRSWNVTLVGSSLCSHAVGQLLNNSGKVFITYRQLHW